MKLQFLALIFMLLIVSSVLAIRHRKKSRRRNKYPSKGDGPFIELAGDDKTFTHSLDGISNIRSLEKEESGSDVYKRDSLLDVNAKKRSPAVAAAGAKALKSNPKVEEAVVEKGIEVAGKLVDKQLKIIDDAQQKASDFLKKEIKLDILPEKGWENEDMFLPAGYHINANIEGAEESPKEVGEKPFVFPSGLGGVLMNGCWGTDYKPNDPCYKAKTTSTVCTNMIDGAAFLGVGFDGRGKYSPDSRKMSIVQRNCANKATYDDLDVPDSMNVHGIYDTAATLITFESREEYSKFLQEEAGVSGSYFGFYAGVKSAWGESKQSSRQKFMAVMDVDVDRYEVFMDEVKPKDLSLSFLREYMSLPITYFAVGGPRQYQNFIQRWGTHFIKSAKFGGQLEIRKTMDAEDVKSKKEFEIKMEMEYKSLFSSVNSKYSREEKESERKQTKTTSTSVVAQGGSQDIASILSDVYSPTFKTEFKDWLKSIPSYPKAFHFQMGSITDLLNFRADDLFPEGNVTWGCEGNAEHLLTEVKDGKTVRYYEVIGEDGTKNKYYCDFDNREVMEDAIQRRRSSLLRAIEIYMEEGPISISDIEVHAYCQAKPGDQMLMDEVDENGTSYGHPTWEQITNGNSAFNISFDMLDDLPSSIRMALNIQRKTNRLVRFENNLWHTSDQDGAFHLYGIFNNGGSKILSRRKMSIFGLVLTYNEADGSLVLSPLDYKASKKFFPTLQEDMTGIQFAQVKIPFEQNSKRAALLSDTQSAPCRVDWSNNLRFDPTDTKGKCLHFTASAKGELFVIFAALPKDRSTWYYVEIAPTRASIYKGATLKTKTTNLNARALGDASLYQSYFVCITESEKSTLIEYGKTLGSSDSGDVYLNMIDSQDHLHVRFYTFGAARNMAKVMDAHIVPRALTKTQCKGDTILDEELNVCVQNCHKDCDPLAGCKQGNNPAFPAACHACRVAVDTVNDKCIPECPPDKTLTKEKTCVPTFDILFKPSVDYNQLKIEDKEIPTLKELTLCFWLRLEGKWGPENENDVYLVRYMLNSHSRDFFYTTIESSVYRPGGIDFLFQLPKTSSKWIHVDELDNQKWLQMCVAWSGFTGVAVYYKNGKRFSSEMKKRGQRLNGGGTLYLGGLYQIKGSGNRKTTLHFTGVNLWNRVLSDQEIAKNAQRCDGGEGNVKNWLSWLDVAKAAKKEKRGYLRFDSQCQASTPKQK